MSSAETRQLFDVSTITPYLEQGFTVLTPNRRLARRISAEWHRLQSAAGHVAWLSPDVHPLDSWLSARYEQAVLDGQCEALALLSAAQQEELWLSTTWQAAPRLNRLEVRRQVA